MRFPPQARALLPEATSRSPYQRSCASMYLQLHSIAMDSPVLNQLFRQLFRHPACQSLRKPPPSLSRQTRTFLTRRAPTGPKRKSQDDGMFWTKRGDIPKNIEQEYLSYPTVTAKDLRHRRERPRQVKMLTREFIDGEF